MLKKSNNAYEQLNSATIFIFIFLSGLILPAVLIPVVRFTGYSEIIEEISKALIVIFLILKITGLKRQTLCAVIFGFLFGFSESIFYLGNILQTGNFNIFFERFLFAVPLHIITVLIILFFGLISKYLLPLGVAIAIIIHLLFNIALQ